MYNSISEIKIKNKEINQRWFSPQTMKFFNSKIETGVLKGKYFITSERREKYFPKKYSIRKAEENGSIDTIGEFQQFSSIEEAKDFLDSSI